MGRGRGFINAGLPGVGAGLLEKEPWKPSPPWPAWGPQEGSKKHTGSQGEFLICTCLRPKPKWHSEYVWEGRLSQGQATVVQSSSAGVSLTKR